jgi:hypothetical protein
MKETTLSKQIDAWTKLYVESLNEEDFKQSSNENDIINTCFSTLLFFLAGEGNKVLKDSEWMMYLVNDINAAIDRGIFNPQFDDKQHLKAIMQQQYEIDENAEEEADDEAAEEGVEDDDEE